MPIETVLLAVGRDDDARLKRMVDVAADLAESADARVIVAHAFESQDAVDDVLDRLAIAEGTPDDVTRRLESVRVAEEALETAGVNYEVRGLVGDPGQAVADLAGDVGADHVIVGGRTRSPTGKAVFGSTAQEILLSAPCPVTFVRE